MFYQNDPRDLVGWQDAVDVAQAKLELARAQSMRIADGQFQKYQLVVTEGRLLGVEPRPDAVARNIIYFQSHLFPVSA